MPPTGLCPSGFTECNGSCIDLSDDAGHCGACGTSCLRDGSYTSARQIDTTCGPQDAIDDVVIVTRPDDDTTATWAYGGSFAGRVDVGPSQKCPTRSSPTWN